MDPLLGAQAKASSGRRSGGGASDLAQAFAVSSWPSAFLPFYLSMLFPGKSLKCDVRF